MSPHLLIDADLLIYKASAGAEFECDWGGDNWVLSANLQQAKDAITSRLEGMFKHFNAKSFTLVLSDRENFRVNLNADYKSARKNTRKPIIYNQVKEWIIRNWGAMWNATLEADDTLGILQTSGRFEDSIVVSEDKDMLTVPGKLYRGGELLHITEEQADYHHALQTLTGDPTDGYKGCPGIGVARATKALQCPPEARWEAIVNLYVKAGLTEADALMNARMAYILRAANWNNETQEVRLWEPSR